MMAESIAAHMDARAARLWEKQEVYKRMIQREQVLTVEQAGAMVDAAMAYRGEHVWFLDGTREKAIEAGWNAVGVEHIIDSISEALEAGEIRWSGDDPHDWWGRAGRR